MTPHLGPSPSGIFNTCILQMLIYPTEVNRRIQKQKVRRILYSLLNTDLWASSSEAVPSVESCLLLLCLPVLRETQPIFATETPKLHNKMNKLSSNSGV